MKRLIDLAATEARAHFLKGSSYFNGDFPNYISFEPILSGVATVLAGGDCRQFQSERPSKHQGVNYSLIANKDGRFAWRPYELLHPAIYVSLVNVITDPTNWLFVQERYSEFSGGVVDCCSAPVVSDGSQTDTAAQVRNWWQGVEQSSLKYSLNYSHVLHTDVTDCYGSLYTHSIAWALHGIEAAKENQGNRSLLGNQIDSLIQASRYGQTNGIAQGSVLMDFVAELVLGYVDSLIQNDIGVTGEVKILRYRDDYRIFAKSDSYAEYALKIVSDRLRAVGMKLGVAKTQMCSNVVEGAIKPDKLAGLELQDFGSANAKTIQKQLLRLHSFGQRFPNSGTLRKLVGGFHSSIVGQKTTPDELEVLVAIATDIAFVSPATFPAVAGILSHLISLTSGPEKQELWAKVKEKMARVPYNGYLEVWLQRVVRPSSVGANFDSREPICQIVNGDAVQLWENCWVSSRALLEAMATEKIVVGDVGELPEVVQPSEVELFLQNAYAY